MVYLVRAMLFAFGFVSLGGIIWYSTTLSAISLACGITTCISGFVLGIADLQKQTSVFKSTFLAVLAISGVLASGIKMSYDSNMFSDIWGGIFWLYPLVLFAFALKFILKPKNIATNEKDIDTNQLTSH